MNILEGEQKLADLVDAILGVGSQSEPLDHEAVVKLAQESQQWLIAHGWDYGDCEVK